MTAAFTVSKAVAIAAVLPPAVAIASAGLAGAVGISTIPIERTVAPIVMVKVVVNVVVIVVVVVMVMTTRWWRPVKMTITDLYAITMMVSHPRK
jgi:hypothetical protein